MSYRIQSRHLYIADLVRRQHEMESGRVPMDALAYRVLAKQLHQALAGLPASSAHAGLSDLPPALMARVGEALERNHFDQHGRLYGFHAAQWADDAQALIRRASRPTSG